jgi:hypothetical protein
VYLTTIATNAPGGPIALNAGDASTLNILADGVAIGTLSNAAAAIADGAAIPLSAPDLDGGEHLVAEVVNTPAGAENLSTLRITFVLEADPR